ncbi:MAG: tetratricopeptide repeat protein [Bacteroidota bacterium]|nr:tetratricopeptide repeat protein [Bacteroidota bacterium]
MLLLFSLVKYGYAQKNTSPIYENKEQSINEQFSEHDKTIYRGLIDVLLYAEKNNLTKADNQLKLLHHNIEKESSSSKFKALYDGMESITAYRKGNFRACLKTLDPVVRTLSETKHLNTTDKYLLAQLLKYMGRTYSEVGIYTRGISYLDQSNALFSEIGVIEKTFENYKYIGRIFQRHSVKIPEVSPFIMLNYNKAMKGFKKYRMYDELPWIYTIIADYYLKKNNAKSAKLYQDSAFVLLNDDDYLLMGLSYNNTGKSYFISKNYKKAKKNYQAALSYYALLNNSSNAGVTYGNLAELNFETGDISQAIVYADSALMLAQKAQSLIKTQRSYARLAKFYQYTGNTEKAYKHLVSSQNISDSISSQEHYNKLYAYKVLYETARKEKALNKVRYEMKRITQGGIAFMLLLLLSAFFFRRQYLLKKDKERQQILIEGQELEQERFAKEIHDDIAGNITGIKLMITNNENASDFSKITQEIDKIHHDLRVLSHNLSKPHLHHTKFNNKIKTYLSRTVPQTIKISFINNENLENVSQNILHTVYRIIQEIVQNIIKHSEASKAFIQIIKDKKQLTLIAEDNGKGFDPSDYKEGIGLKNINLRLKAVDGKLEIDSSPGRGAIFIINLRIKTKSIFSGFQLRK